MRWEGDSTGIDAKRIPLLGRPLLVDALQHLGQIGYALGMLESITLPNGEV
ncbi:MAG: hypothetical protein RI637_08685 [Acidimicrobiia bacterium]|nr:hypothetical protein [Acidimicrobiia bacterium]